MGDVYLSPTGVNFFFFFNFFFIMDPEMQNRCTEKDPEDCVDDDNGPWSEDSMNGCESPPPEEKPDECQPHENDALNPWDFPNRPMGDLLSWPPEKEMSTL